MFFVFFLIIVTFVFLNVLTNLFLFSQTVSEAFREANLAASFGKAINF